MSRSRDYIGDIPVEIADRILQVKRNLEAKSSAWHALEKPLMRYCPICKWYYPAKKWKRKVDPVSGFEYDESPCGHRVWVNDF